MPLRLVPIESLLSSRWRKFIFFRKTSPLGQGIAAIWHLNYRAKLFGHYVCHMKIYIFRQSESKREIISKTHNYDCDQNFSEATSVQVKTTTTITKTPGF